MGSAVVEKPETWQADAQGVELQYFTALDDLATKDQRKEKGSIAAGLRSSNATVACIASITDPKKISPRPLSGGNGEIFSSAEKIAANVPSLPARISLRFFFDREKRSIP